VGILEGIVATTGRRPTFIRMDNGPEMTAAALRDWCRCSRTDTSDIEPGHPWENPHIESFTGKLRDELLDAEAFATLLEAKTLAEDYRIGYNSYRPHSSLGYRTPASFAAEWAQQPTGIT
jgi:transposase InsO family protein